MPYQANLTGWGRDPVREFTVWQPTTADTPHATLASVNTSIARGNGRSYGDASINVDFTIDMQRLDRLIAFDEATSTLLSGVGAFGIIPISI
jgi:decaprenylphospho-beta-D-ribofuranose 2-oxidase